MANLYKRAGQLGGVLLSTVMLSACVAVDVPATPAPPLPDTAVYFNGNADVDKEAAARQTCPTAQVPDFALEERLEGWAVAGVDLRPDGTVEKVTIHASSDPRFEAAARACFTATTFHPAVHQGQPVAYRNHPMVMHFKVNAKELRLFGIR